MRKLLLLAIACIGIFGCSEDKGTPEEQFDKAKSYAGNKDFKNAVKYYRSAAKRGHAEAQNNLGWCYENGKGVEQDTLEAVKWYRKSAEQGHAMAQYNLGMYYEKVREPYKAVEWFRKAAEQDNADAQCHLAWCYENNWGVARKNQLEADKWWNRARTLGSQRAIKHLGNHTMWQKLKTEGVFGVRFGDKLFRESNSPNDDLKNIDRYHNIDLSNTGYNYYKGGWDEICVGITPASHKIYRITASKKCINKEVAESECDKLIALFENKYDVSTKKEGFIEGLYTGNGFRIEIKRTWNQEVEIKYVDLSLELKKKQEHEDITSKAIDKAENKIDKIEI